MISRTKQDIYFFLFSFIFYFFCAVSVNWYLFKNKEINPIRDGINSILATVESIVERHSFIIDESRFLVTGDKMKVGRHYYSDKAPGFSLTLVPIYWLLYNYCGLSLEQNLFLCVLIFTTYGVVVPATVGLLLFEKIAINIYNKTSYTTIRETTKILAFGTIIVSFSGLLNYHSIVMFLLLLSFYLVILEIESVRHDNSGRYVFVSGLGMGLLFSIDIPTGGIFVLLIIFLFLLTKKYKSLTGFLIGLLPLVITYELINFSITGKLLPPFFYRHDFYQFEGSVHKAISLTGEMGTNHFFNLKRFILIYRNFIGSIGLFSISPILFFSIIGWITSIRKIQPHKKFHRNRYLILVVFLGAVVQVLFYNIVVPSATGCVYGVRHAIPVIPFLILGLIPLIENRAHNKELCTIVLISVIFCVGGAFQPKKDCNHFYGWRQLIPSYSFFHSLKNVGSYPE